ncbi:MAG: MarR family winged helix-turn-helix transcriptional regulator [Ignavibacteriales bacterium]
MKNRFSDIYSLLQELSWHFGNHGVNGECCGDLSLAEFMALKKVFENENCSVQEIGNGLNFTKSGATKIVNRLEGKGYVARQNSPADGRVCCVSMNPKGRDAVSDIYNNYTAYLQDLLKDFEPQEVEQIQSALEMLVSAIQKNKSSDTFAAYCDGGKCS